MKDSTKESARKRKERPEEIRPAGRKTEYRALLWACCPAGLLFAGTLAAFRSSCGSMAPGWILPALAGAVGILCATAGRFLKRKNRLFGFLWVLPLVAALLTGVIPAIRGLVLYVNILLTRWNQVYESGVILFKTTAGEADLAAFALAGAVFVGELLWLLVYHRGMLLAVLHSFFWLLLLVLGHNFTAMSCALLLAGALGCGMSGEKAVVSEAGRIWSIVLALVLLAGASAAPAGRLDSVENFRKSTGKCIEELCYGVARLPEGSIAKARMLNGGEAEMLRIQSGQEKNLYLKGFVGAVLKDNQWKELPASAYGGDNTGMLDWLLEQGFDPLTQSALYYRLCDEEDRPEDNWLTLSVTGASRYYYYAPSSLEEEQGRVADRKDLRKKSTGFFGRRQYRMQELSGSRPSELTIAADWVSDPATEEQTAYSQAESVYRQFVYGAYTMVDADLNELMQSWFWEDYESDSDGIYSAVTHIREKLKSLSYMEDPGTVPGDQEDIRWFLTEGRVGNAVLFASTAVEALRAHGIPARYVEGYYLPASAIDADGNAVLKGSHAHAWTEVYFDGVGWLPVDVTPGYYYEAVVLQQMVSAPDAVRKTAALQDSSLGADELTGLNENQKSEAKEPLEIAGDVTLALLGAAALVILLGAVVFALMEVARALKLRARTRWYQNASPLERMTEMEQELFRYLRFLGIEASLGWNTEQVDRELTGRVEQVEAGEYTRACRLLEKTIYGGIDPEPFEERTLHHFLEKLEAKGRQGTWRTRLGFRYESLG